MNHIREDDHYMPLQISRIDEDDDKYSAYSDYQAQDLF